MFETIRNAWKLADLRKKILFTFLILIIFRIGSVIPVPYIDVNALSAGSTNEFFSYLSILTGGGLEYGAIFAMSVTPYINSSIIIQLLCVAIPALERLQKEEKRLEGELKRSNAMLNNEKFLSKAPESKIAEEKEKLEKYTQMMQQVKERLAQLS